MSLRVLRVYHSAVVADWRRRDRLLREGGVDLTLVSPLRWNEGGRDVALESGDDHFVVGARTFGRHPYAFLYNPVPIARAMRSGRFDVLDIHEEPASLAALELRILAGLFQRGIPIVFYGAQNIEKRFPLPFRWIERSSLRRASGAYCCNRAAADIFRQRGLRHNARVIGLGVDTERFSSGDRPRTGSGPLTVGYVGRLEAHKGVGVLLDAIARLDGVALEICGDGPDREALAAHADRVGMTDRVVFNGFVDRDELPSHFAGFDLLAVPSLPTARVTEQFGRVVVEAMAAGVPVVASDVGALADVVADAGVLVPPGDVTAWQEALAELTVAADRRRELSERGLRRVVDYSWESIAEAHHELYVEVAR